MTRLLDERQLSQYLDTYLQRKYGRLLDHQWFRGTITSVSRLPVTANASGYAVQLIRSGESAADGGQYPVLGSYVPVVGDVVECVWRDNNTAYVLGSLAPQLVPWKFAEVALTANAASVTLPVTGLIPSGYRELDVTCSVRGDTAALNVTMMVRFNGDAGTGYYDELNAQSGVVTTVPVEDNAQTSFRLGNISAATATAHSYSRVAFRVAQYTSPKFKAITGTLARLDNGTAGNDAIVIASGWWTGSPAITSMTFSLTTGNFVGALGTETSVFSLVLQP